jgi:diguanylate cyclase (GGDEF)-like protein
MNKFVSTALILLGLASVLRAAPAPFTTLKALKSITNAEASKGLPADFEATVTCFRGYQKVLFVQDGNDAIFVKITSTATFVPGDRVRVKGVTQASFHPIVVSGDVTLIGHAKLPNPVPATFEDLINARYDSMLVTIKGVIRTADLNESPGVNGRGADINLAADGGPVAGFVETSDMNALKGLLDAEVEVTGVSGGRFDGKMQLTAVQLNINSLSDVKVIKPAAFNPWSLPLTPMGEILKAYHVDNLTQRTRVRGAITYYQPGSAVVLQTGASSLWLKTQSFAPLRIGDLADAVGFPSDSDGFLTLGGSEIEDNQVAAPIVPAPMDWQQLASSKHLYDLVSIKGQVVAQVRQTTQDEYVLSSGGHLFSANYGHAAAGDSLQPVKPVRLGSMVRVTGICVLESADPFSGDVPFKILMRTPDDIEVIAKPSWLSIRNLMWMVGLLLTALFALGTREWFVERKIRRQISVLAYVEQRRGRILEDINNARPLAEIIERITEVVSVRLNGAACWCEIVNGARLGNCPRNPGDSSLRVVDRPVSAHSGPPHATIHAAFDSYTKASARESEALAMGAGLATLAIETSRLYTDLVHRSEFDLLTDIENRFSFEHYLETLIQSARRSAGIFGLLYIDVNDFKQVNDVYGHGVGDLYLQEVATRMKHQLRPGDMPARLGGDEFAVAVRDIRGRGDLEEIAQRLDACLSLPFTGQGFEILGSASIGIALYPDDGTTTDGILSAADAAMYVVKQTKSKQRRPHPATSSAPETTQKIAHNLR